MILMLQQRPKSQPICLLKMTCINNLKWFFSNTESLRVHQIDHKRAAIPTQINIFYLFFAMPINQFPSICLTDLGGVKPVAMWKTLQMSLAWWQLKKRCLIVSLQSQKQHFWLPTQFLLFKLSFVKMTPRCRYQRKIFIFRGIFSSHMILLSNDTPWFIIYSYIDQTENCPCRYKSQVKISLPYKSWWLATLATRLHQEISLSPTNALQKEIFNGIWFITFSTIKLR
jgi:hypothetical protein